MALFAVVGDEIQEVPLLLHEGVARGARPVVQLRGRGDEHAAAGQPALLRPQAPVRKEGAQTRLAARGLERRLDDDLHEPLRRVLEDGDLQALLRAEVREEAALGELELLGQLPDREPLEARLARDCGGPIQDRLPGDVALAHADNLERSFVPVKGVSAGAGLRFGRKMRGEGGRSRPHLGGMMITAMPAPASPDPRAAWKAVVARDASQDGRFVFAVATTGVYCRPSCAARRPNRENVRFFAGPGRGRGRGLPRLPALPTGLDRASRRRPRRAAGRRVPRDARGRERPARDPRARRGPLALPLPEDVQEAPRRHAEALRRRRSARTGSRRSSRKARRSRPRASRPGTAPRAARTRTRRGTSGRRPPRTRAAAGACTSGTRPSRRRSGASSSPRRSAASASSRSATRTARSRRA